MAWESGDKHVLKSLLLPALTKHRKSLYRRHPECYGAKEHVRVMVHDFFMLWCIGCLLNRVQAAGSVGCVHVFEGWFTILDTTEIIMYWDQINKIRHLLIHLFPQTIWLKHDKLRCTKIMWRIDLSPNIRLHQITNQANLRLPDNAGVWVYVMQLASHQRPDPSLL